MFEQYGYNPDLVKRYISLFGNEVTAKLLQVNELPLKKSIRINTLRIKPNECISRLSSKGFSFSKIRWCDYGFNIENEPNSIGATTEYLTGDYYVQDSTSMVPPLELAPSKNDLVLDMTAAPGGKTTHLAQIMDNTGVIVAVDMNKEKMRAMRSNIQRCGVENVIAIRMKAQELPTFNLKFDKILLDAPCTGEGTIRKNPERRKSLKLEDFEAYSDRQKEMIGIAAQVLKKKGVLVYSTCSLAPEENEMVIEHAVSKGFEVLNLKNKLCSKGLTEIFGERHPEYLKKCGRFYPHIHDTQGFFVAKLIKL
jgi:NOL1/NOP2/sun family putative RNA methylase